MNAVIVAKTRMGKNICVGAADANTGEPLRLIPRAAAIYHSWPEFTANIGDLVALTGAKAAPVEPPHVEDFLVDRWSMTGRRARDLAGWIRGRCRVWSGERSSLFEGTLRFTAMGKGHIDRGDPLPANSVGFWAPHAPLRLEPGGKMRYTMTGRLPVSAPYVGVDPPPTMIGEGQLVRVSLSRWWSPDDGGMPEACWLQISGCYPPRP